MPSQADCYAAQEYCFFCQNELPFLGSTGSPDPTDDWELKVLGFLNLTRDFTLPPRVHIIRTNLSHNNSVYNPPLLLEDQHGKVRAIRVCHKTSRDYYEYPHRPLFFVHLTCWKVARSVQPHLSSLEIYKFARRLHPILPRNCWIEEESCLMAKFPKIDIDTSTDLGHTFSRCVELPEELQIQLLEHIPTKGFLFSLLTAYKTTLLLLKPLLPHISHFQSLIPEGYGGKTGWLHTSFISICGNAHLHRMWIDQHSDEHAIEIDVQGIRKARFVVGSHGLSAIKFEYYDGSSLPWLGDPRKGWHGSLLDISAADLGFAQDGLKVRRISSVHPRPTNSFPQRALWDIYPDQYEEGELHILGAMSQLTRQVKHYHDWRLCRYLPLQLDGQQATGLTVYSDVDGTNRIIVHGGRRDHEVASSNKGVPMYFQLREGEHIVSLAMVKLAFNPSLRSLATHIGNLENPPGQNGGFLLLRTNFHRSAFFGPIAMLLGTDTKCWSLIPERFSANEVMVKGLIADVLQIKYSDLRVIGAHVIIDESQGGRRLAPNQDIAIPAFQHRPNFVRRYPEARQTIARLFDIKRLKIQMRDISTSGSEVRQRCTGLCVHHDDGLIETLGQWDGSLKRESKTIYDADMDGPLTALVFHFTRINTWDLSQADVQGYMTDISVRFGQWSEENEGRDFEYPILCWEISENHQFMAWWFTQFFDYAEEWDSGMAQVQLLRLSEQDYPQIEHREKLEDMF